VAQHNAALVEETTATAETQDQLARHLVEIMKRFKLSDLNLDPTPAPAAKTRAGIRVSAISAPRAKLDAAHSQRPASVDDAADWKEF
jgi:hypothetical protein